VDGEISGYLLARASPCKISSTRFIKTSGYFFRALTRYSGTTNGRVVSFGGSDVRLARSSRPAAARTAFSYQSAAGGAKSFDDARADECVSELPLSLGEKRVCGQIVTFESRRGEKMFERYGFKVLNRAEYHQIQSVLSRIGLPQYRHQELGDPPTRFPFTHAHASNANFREQYCRCAAAGSTVERKILPFLEVRGTIESCELRWRFARPPVWKEADAHATVEHCVVNCGRLKVFNPQSPQARAMLDLAIVVIAVMVVIFAIVVGIAREDCGTARQLLVSDQQRHSSWVFLS